MTYEQRVIFLMTEPMYQALQADALANHRTFSGTLRMACAQYLARQAEPDQRAS